MSLTTFFIAQKLYNNGHWIIVISFIVIKLFKAAILFKLWHPVIISLSSIVFKLSRPFNVSNEYWLMLRFFMDDNDSKPCNEVSVVKEQQYF